MKNFKSYIAVLTLCLISGVSLKADVKRIPICTNSGNVFLPASEKSKMNGNEDGILICWLNESANGSLNVQKLDVMGNAEWADNGVLIAKDLGSGFTSDSDYPQLFSDNEGGAVIIFRKVSLDREDIYMQRDFQNGEEWLAPVCLSSFYEGYNYSPSAVMVGDKAIAVTWENFREGDFDIHAQLVSLNGRKLWNRGNEIKVCKEEKDQRKPAIACSEDDKIMISWLDGRGFQEYTFNLYADIFNIQGESLFESRNGKLIFKNTYNAGSRKETMFHHNFVASEKNSFIFALEHSRDQSFSNVIVLKVNENLDRVWLKDLGTGSHQFNPLITSDNNYGAGIIWNNSKKDQNDIYGIVIDKDGNTTWGNKKGMKISCDKIKNAEARILPSEKNKNGFCIHQNNLISNWVTASSNLLYSLSISLSDESGQYEALEIQDEISEGEYTSITAVRNNIVTVYKQADNIVANVRNISENGVQQISQHPELDNFPNPFNPSTKIYFSIPSDGFVRLSVYDITGRMINTLVNENMNSGNHRVTFDGSNLSSGVYFYRLEANGAAHTKRMTMLK